MAHKVKEKLFRYDKQITLALNTYSDYPLVSMAYAVSIYLARKEMDMRCKVGRRSSTPLKNLIEKYKADKTNLYFSCFRIIVVFYDAVCGEVPYSHEVCDNYRKAFELIYKDIEGGDPCNLSDDFLAKWYIDKGSKAAQVLIDWDMIDDAEFN